MGEFEFPIVSTANNHNLGEANHEASAHMHVITGLPDDGEADCMATYVVRDSKIAKMTFVWRPRTKGTKM
eukprot:364585-Chlamydomonas_euryale.AAC.14